MASRTSKSAATSLDLMAPGPSAAASDGDIARRAYELFEARGARDGQDMDDWLRAESELRPRLNEPNQAS